MNVTKVKQQQGWYMDKILSIVLMGVWAQRLAPRGARENRVNRSTAQIYGVGETPLNRKGLLVTRNGDDEEIV